MLKKRAAILFLTLAYAIMLGHNIIPHHHHHNFQDLAEHHHAGHHDHDMDNDGLSQLFSHFIHSADSFTFPATHIFTGTFFKKQLSFVAVLPDHFSLNKFLVPPIFLKPLAEHLIYISPHSRFYGLRAPPTTFI